MEAPAASKTAYLPPIPLHATMYQSKIRYKELVAKLIRIYQTYACSLSKDEQLDFCAMMEYADYEGDCQMTAHKAFRQMYCYTTKPWDGGKITFARWALMTSLYYKPPSNLASLEKLAKAVTLLGLQFRPCFGEYKCFHETNLARLDLPSAEQLAGNCSVDILFKATDQLLSLYNPNCKRGFAIEPAREAHADAANTSAIDRTSSPDDDLIDVDTEGLYNFIRDLHATFKDSARDPEDDSAKHCDDGGSEYRPRGSRSSSPSVTAPASPGAGKDSPKTPNRSESSDGRVVKHRLAESPADPAKPPPKKQDRRNASGNPPQTTRRALPGLPSGVKFFEEMNAFYIANHEILEAIQDRLDGLDSGIRGAAPDTGATDSLVAEMKTSSAAFQEEVRREMADLKNDVASLKSDFKSLASRHQEMETKMADGQQAWSDTLAEQAKRAATQSGNTSRALTRMGKKQDKLAADFEDHLEKMTQEIVTAENHRDATDSALRELKDRMSGAAPALSRDDVANILEELFKDKLVSYLRLYSRVKEEK